LKKDAVPKDSAKDIKLLFSRAGMSGAKYREFPRQGGGPAPVNSSAEAAASPHPAAPASSAPATSVAAALAPPAPAGAPPSYSFLERVLAGSPAGGEAEPAIRSGVRLAIASLAGGVGKTTLAATLARALSGMRKQVIVADCGPYPSVAQHLGAQGQRLGPLQFFFSPSPSAPMPVAVFNMSAGQWSGEDFQNLAAQGDSAQTVMLMDIPTLQGGMPAEVLGYASHALVPVTPDMHSVAGVAHLQALFGQSAEPAAYYVINRFDESRALHRAIRSRLQELLGPRLLPIAIRDDQGVEEASAQGMTVVDAFPGSGVADDFAALAEWSCALSPAPLSRRKDGLA